MPFLNFSEIEYRRGKDKSVLTITITAPSDAASAALHILMRIGVVICDPFTGRGKPEPLKGLVSSEYTRRITRDHRPVYVVKNDGIECIQAIYRY